MKKIGEEIKRRRKLLNITQKTLSELAGVGINTLTKMERGEANPTIDVLEKVLNTLGMEINVTIKGK
jgi:transcriptional regulator with XRE-family HTH domain